MTVYTCCDENRVDAVRGHATLNGIAYLEVQDDSSLPDDQRQRVLDVHLVNPLSPALAGALTDANVRITGGDRIRTIDIIGVVAAAGDEVVTVTVAAPGDFAPYTLRLVKGAGVDLPPDGIDPVLATVTFSFKVGCESGFDCKAGVTCPPTVFDEPDLDYLAKDYASFRQLMLDRMSVLAPQWEERSPADTGVMLVELLAYVGDYLSYAQDAAATEAYLHTARRRVSVRRHARLLDYHMHDGCNARAWVQIQTGLDGARVPAGTMLMTTVANQATVISPASDAFEQAVLEGADVFETMHDLRLFVAHNEIKFHTWGDERCCLPAGARRATLRGALPDLTEGDVLIFEERRGPRTGAAGDADPEHRHAVRLIAVDHAADPLQAANGGAPVTHITWAAADALPFPVCISARVQEGDHAGSYDDVSVARGNIVLADHGITVNAGGQEVFDPVPEATLARVAANPPQMCGTPVTDAIRPRYTQVLAQSPLTHAVPYGDGLFSLDLSATLQSDLDAGSVPARLAQAFAARGISLAGARLRVREPGSAWVLSGGGVVYDLHRATAAESTGAWTGRCRDALSGHATGTGTLLQVTALPVASMALITAPASAQPAICLLGTEDGEETIWEPVRDLLNSNATSAHFVVEIEGDGTAMLRFGDGTFGNWPDAGTKFLPRYRTGNGREGNIGADTLSHVVTGTIEIADAVAEAVKAGLSRPVRNPLPARGGADPETMEAVRQAAPVAFRTQKRAVTPEDYAAFAAQHPEVQRAEATMRWTGSWYTVFIAVDRVGGKPVDAAFSRALVDHLAPYRMAGHDIEIDPPDPVPLELAMTVCVQPDAFRSEVRARLLEIFTAGLQPDGTLGLFHPDRFTFGQTITLSPFIAAAQAIPGVKWVEVTGFGRQDDPDPTALDRQRLTLGRLQITQLDNDPNYPKRGVFRLTLEGGK